MLCKSIKISSQNRKLTELLFENIKVKKTLFKLTREKNNKTKTNEKNKNIVPRRSCNIKNDYSSLQLKNQNNQNLIEAQNFDKFSIEKINDDSELKSIKLNKKFTNLNNDSNKDKDNNKDNTKVNKIFISNETSLNLPFSDISSRNKNNESKNMNRQLLKTFFRTKYIRKSLFPFKYYLCSIFIKNFYINKKYSFLSKKFIVVYDFICQLSDISSYFILQREFQIMKNNILDKKHKNILEKGQKVNINDQSFQIDMNECLNTKKLSILGKIKQNKNFK